MRTVKSEHQRATEALQAAQRRHDKARAKADELSAKVEALRDALAVAEVEERKSLARLQHAQADPALADEDTAGDGGEMAAT